MTRWSPEPPRRLRRARRPVADGPDGPVEPHRPDRPATGSERTTEAGFSTLELAIFLPVMLLIVLFLAQMSLYWHTANVVGVAAEEGVDAGQLDGGDTAEAEAAAQYILSTSSARNAVPAAAINGDLITVTVTAEAPRVAGWGTWRVRSVAQGRIEEFVPADER